MTTTVPAAYDLVTRRLITIRLGQFWKNVFALSLGDVIDDIPTIGFHAETIKCGNLTITAWDTGGRSAAYKPFKRRYQQGTDAIVWMVDSLDWERIDEVKTELWELLAEESLRGVMLLVLANKRDLGDDEIMSINKIKEFLELESIKDRKWEIMGTSCIAGDGLEEGFQWLSEHLVVSAPSKMELLKKALHEISARFMNKELFS